MRESEKLAIKIFSMIFLISSGIIYFMFLMTNRSEISSIKSRERIELSGHNSVVVRIINSLTSDALFLSKLPDVKHKDDTLHIAESFLQFSDSKKIYDQVRLLNENGEEEVRINWNNGDPEIIEKRKLQNKKGRYYFDDTIKLLDEQIFISPLDLNIERGEIEEPFKPMLRVGTPIFDHNKSISGIILLNYFAKDLIDELKSNIKAEYSEIQMLNEEGYWLYSNKKDEEWGFMFPEKTDRIFSNKYSEKIWKQINEKNSGQLDTEFGLFTYSTVFPLSISHSSSTGAGNAYDSSSNNVEWLNYKWKLVSFIPKDKLKNLTWPIRRNYFFPWLAFTIFAAFISYILSKNIVRRKLAEQKRLDVERKYRVLFEEASESIVVTKKEQTIMANARTEKLFEYSEEELLSTPIQALFHTEDRKVVTQNQIKQINENIESMVFEARILTKAGNTKWAEIRSTKMDLRNEGVLLYFFLDITDRKELEFQLRELATTDPLTGCYNRRYFTNELEREITRSRRLNFNLSVVMCDLDKFKGINDTFGHDIGDLVLKKFIQLTNKEIRTIDTLGRLGGEEFAIILPNCNETNAFNCAERIRLELQRCVITPNSMVEKVCFTSSFGVSELKDFDDVASILKKADNALYKAKESGRNKTIISS